MAKGEVAHKGIVTAVDPQFTTVTIVSESACASCHAAGLCGMSESVHKTVKVATPQAGACLPGDEVNVVLRTSMGHKAVWIAYVIPLAVLMGVILGLLSAGVSEPLSGLSGIAAAAAYYGLVWLFRERLQDQYIFTIRK